MNEPTLQQKTVDVLSWVRNIIPVIVFISACYALYFNHEGRISMLEQDKKFQEASRAQDLTLLNAKLDSLKDTVLEMKQTVKDIQQFQRK